MQKDKREFNQEALCAEPVFYRTYSRRKEDGSRESFAEVCKRAVKGVVEAGNLSKTTEQELFSHYVALRSLPAGRWLWIGGTQWSLKLENHYSGFNCASLPLKRPEYFGLLAYLAMQGCGTGANLEERYISQLPLIRNRIKYSCFKLPGERNPEDRLEDTVVETTDRLCTIYVGDSKEGWRDAYQALIDLALYYQSKEGVLEIEVDFSSVRPKGEILKGFGGVANPNTLSEQFRKVANHLSRAQGRQLTAEECCLVIDEMASAIVSGSIRRSAGIRQFDSTSPLLKQNLWKPDENGDWYIDPKRDALRMANHSRNYYTPPSLQEVTDAVRSQFYSGEGAIFWAPESLARSNSDLFFSREEKDVFIKEYLKSEENAKELIKTVFQSEFGEEITDRELNHRLRRSSTNPCFEGNTLILTDQGDIPIKDLVGRKVRVWTGENWETVDNFRITGYNKDIYKVTLFDGRTILATENHTFILEDGTRKELSDLMEGDCLLTHEWYYDEDWQDLLTVVPCDRLCKEAKVRDVSFYGNEPYVYCCTIPITHSIALTNGIITGQCGEILGSEFLCCLAEIPLINLDPEDFNAQKEAFKAGALSTGALLNLKFENADMQYSRDIDPIVGVGFTGLFDFFVKCFGVEWLEWWSEGRPNMWSSDNWPKDKKMPQSESFRRAEKVYLNYWRSVVHNTLKGYCDEHGLRVPNRYTCVKPAGTMSNLSNSSSGWHPPKAIYYIRRITFRREDPVALACYDFGYNVVPSQSDKDEQGNLLNDPFSERCTEWLVEIPMKAAWADIPGADQFDPSQFSALAQFDFFMTVQKEYVTHNTSATIELRENEIEDLSKEIHTAILQNEGYVSAALLSRFDDYQSYPRLPFEPITQEKYEELFDQVQERQKVSSFHEALEQYDVGELEESGPVGCDSDKCTFPS